jgi:hypothetical protein
VWTLASRNHPHQGINLMGRSQRQREGEAHAERVVGGVHTFSVTGGLVRWATAEIVGLTTIYFPKMRRSNPLPFLPLTESAG